MAKRGPKDTAEVDDILDALGVEVEAKKKPARSAKEARIIAGFEDITRFVAEHGRAPQRGEDRDIFERLYAVRLDRLRAQADCRAILAEFDVDRLLEEGEAIAEEPDDVDGLLNELGVEAEPSGDDITQLRHVRSREEVRVAEEIASRTVCQDFDRFEPLFEKIKREIENGHRETRRFEKKAEIDIGRFFVVGGMMAYVADAEEEFLNDQNKRDRRLRLVYDNGTESNLLLRSLQKALTQDPAGRRVTEPAAGPLFGGQAGEGDVESGTIYVLRSLSDDPRIAGSREVIHKIGVTGGTVKTRITDAKNQPTYLMADVEVAAEFKLHNINRVRLENLLHKVFAPARLDLEFTDRFGKPVRPREWFLVPLAAVNEAVERVQDGSITSVRYDPQAAQFVPFMDG